MLLVFPVTISMATHVITALIVCLVCRNTPIWLVVVAHDGCDQDMQLETTNHFCNNMDIANSERAAPMFAWVT